jgi:3-hydroxypropanoate dehydrogenase
VRRIVSDNALDMLFRAPRRPHAWLARPVSDTLLRAVWELVKLGPTSSIGRSARILFVRSDDAKACLAPAVPAEQRASIMTAPIAAIVGSPLDRDRRPAAPREGALESAYQSAYLMLAARALGLDCRPIWELDSRTVDAAFFPEGTVGADFLCALGYGDDSQGDDTQPSPDEPRHALDEACQIL